ncbi:kelch repeat protein [Aspergillus niger ATCC 13496]|uniref:Kelch repeat protein n=1 Tax=Aspergillus niger ATCC 13496 TaxID=1353008 RepID=A0A370BTW3_ASPNG|nr:kelch repeat protein [Aspergillus niger CBS 513.88]RDH18966.1 kelch repeat protein [Aspergillus niger ATCC 13496]|eukprot:XP_001393475.2 kelch repeat protein [Aspergillus niger CBS 513.88]
MKGFAQIVGLYASLAAGRKYCTRTFHSSVINNQTLFIDGGEVRYLEDNNTISAYAIRDLQTVDVSKSFSNTDSDLFTHIDKPYNASDPDEYPTFLDEGSAFNDGENLYFYGGYKSGRDGPKTVPPVETWKYDIQNNNWTRDGFGGVPLVRLIEGGAVVSHSQNKAYYLGGVEDPGGNPNIYGTAGADVEIVSGLLVLDQSTLQWSNLSTSEMNNYGTIGAGYLNLLEDVGDEGLLVAFGGYKYPVGHKVSLLCASQTNTTFHNPMEYINLYDIANQKWYTQQSTGDIPNWRMAGCSVTVAAQDRSSFSIYMFGGMAATTAKSDGDVYVLSLPSFRWIRVNEGSSIREKHTCNVLGKHTMLVVGGTIPTDSSEYEPKPVNCDTGTFENGLAIFDLNQHTWLTDYNADDQSEYALSSAITDVIGGSSTGGANVTQPKNGFNDTTLATMFQKAVITTTTNSTAGANSTSTSASGSSSSTGSSKGTSLSKGGIAGATVGAVVGASAIAGLAFFLIKRRRAQPSQETPAMAHPPVYEPPQTGLAELSSGGVTHELVGSDTQDATAGNWWQKTPNIAEMDGVARAEMKG